MFSFSNGSPFLKRNRDDKKKRSIKSPMLNGINSLNPITPRIPSPQYKNQDQTDHHSQTNYRNQNKE